MNLTKTGVVGKRKVGRPRKYPLMVQTKSEKAQSKSQAITDSPSLKMTFQKVGSSSDKNFILKETSMSSFMEAESKFHSPDVINRPKPVIPYGIVNTN